VSFARLRKRQAPNAQYEQANTSVHAEESPDFSNGAHAITMSSYLPAMSIEQI
jgi:hypothetical protein